MSKTNKELAVEATIEYTKSWNASDSRKLYHTPKQKATKRRNNMAKDDYHVLCCAYES